MEEYMEYEQAMVDYEDGNDIVYCCFPLDIGRVEIFMSESSSEEGISYDVFINKKEFDGGIYRHELFQDADELGNFEYDLCVIDALRYIKQRFQESNLIINT
jgi:hypothetical protein